jgi:hypothetical protein
VTIVGPGRAGGRERPRARRARRGRRFLGWLLGLVLLAAVFFAGLAIGRALEEAPQPGGTQMRVRTIEPLTVAPEERTVTVTTGG